MEAMKQRALRRPMMWSSLGEGPLLGTIAYTPRLPRTGSYSGSTLGAHRRWQMSHVKINNELYNHDTNINHNIPSAWLFYIAMERSTIFKFGKPSISMGHLYHGYVSHNQRVIMINPCPGFGCWSPQRPEANTMWPNCLMRLRAWHRPLWSEVAKHIFCGFVDYELYVIYAYSTIYWWHFNAIFNNMTNHEQHIHHYHHSGEILG